jgi:hypothetical protein
MLFARKKKTTGKLGAMLVNSGSLWVSGRDAGRKAPRSLDDIYSWDEDFRPRPGATVRVGMPGSGKTKAA